MIAAAKRTKRTTDDRFSIAWSRYVATRDVYWRNQLALLYQPLVTGLATKLKGRVPTSIELADLVSVGQIGLLTAIERFEPARGLKFNTFAPCRINGAMLDYLRELDAVPRVDRKRINHLRDVRIKLDRQLGRAPTTEDLAAVMGDKLPRCLRAEAQARSFESPVRLSLTYSGENRESKISDVIPLDQCEPSDREQRLEDLRRILRGCTQRERLILILYYFEELTFREIAGTVGLTESRISQLHSDLLLRLRARLSEAA
jgi:RNA polymerase sigma factor FliA